MPPLPNLHLAHCEASKVRDFVLVPEHRANNGRAVVFYALGYRREEWQVLAGDFCSMLSGLDAVEVECDFGRRFVVEGALEGPTGVAIVRTVWQIDTGTDAPRFLTAYPEVTL